MATNSLPSPSARAQATGLRRFFPFIGWLGRYKGADLPSDLVAGVVTAIMLIPQSMAYAQLAGLPPQIGLYASVLPLAIYALMGSSGQLSVGPVAITSLLVFSGVGALAEPGSARYIGLVLTLALMVGVIKLLLGVLRLGVVLNFISHPVLAAFTTASALIIATGQLKYLLGYKIGGERFYETLYQAGSGLAQTNPATLAIGLASIALLLFFRKGLRPLLARAGLPPLAVTLIVSGAPLVTVLLGTLAVWGFQLNTTAGVSIVGGIPGGLAPFSLPGVSLGDLRALLPSALVIVLVSVVESIAVAKTLASKRRQTIDPNQELIALGLANIAAGFSSGYPVTGGFARSVVNFQAGAITGLASLVTAGGIALILLFFTPLFYFLPQAVLAATVIVAVFGLVDLHEPLHLWKRDRADAATWAITFAAVLLLGIEAGIFAGVGASLLLYLWRTSRPHIAVVGRLDDSEVYRNVLRYQVRTWPHILAIRVDESLYFANTRYLEDAVLRMLAERPEVKHLLLIGAAINYIDSSAMATLEGLIVELKSFGVTLHFADMKGPVMDQLERAGLVAQIGRPHFHLSTHQAMIQLGAI